MKLVNNIIQGLIVVFSFAYLFFVDDVDYYNIIVYLFLPIFFGVNYLSEYILKINGNNQKTLKYLNLYSLVILEILVACCILGFIYFGKNHYTVNLFGILLMSNIYIMLSPQKKKIEELDNKDSNINAITE